MGKQHKTWLIASIAIWAFVVQAGCNIFSVFGGRHHYNNPVVLKERC